MAKATLLSNYAYTTDRNQTHISKRIPSSRGLRNLFAWFKRRNTLATSRNHVLSGLFGDMAESMRQSPEYKCGEMTSAEHQYFSAFPPINHAAPLHSQSSIPSLNERRLACESFHNPYDEAPWTRAAAKAKASARAA
jgi:hypothetical protein